MQSISTGLEQELKIHNFSLPLYIMYRISSLPVRHSLNPHFDVNIDMSDPQFDKNAACNLIEFGGNFNWSRFTIYFAARWNQAGKYKKYPPPIT